MTARDDDRDLREQFVRLRDSSAAGASAFGDVIARGRARRARSAARWRAGAGGVAVAALALLLWNTRHNRGDGAPAVANVSPLAVDLGAVTWRGPTDFLLDTPGREFLQSVPELQVDIQVAPVTAPSRTDSAPSGDSSGRSQGDS